MKEPFCNECGETIASNMPKYPTTNWGDFCSLEHLNTFLSEIEKAGIFPTLREGEEPNVIY